MTLNKIVRRLHALGHAPEFPTISEEFLVWCMEDFGSRLIARYQEHHGLPVSGWACRETVEHLRRPRCAHPDVMAVSSESRWVLPLISYFQQIVYPNVDAATVAAEYAEAVRRMAAVCGIQITPASDVSSAQVLAVSGPIDGQWNILALTELPQPDAGAGTVLHQTFDNAEVGLTSEQRIAMMAHECGHFLGLGHAVPGSGNLMEPILGTISSPQAGDVAELQERYGPPAAAATPAAAPPPSPTPATTPAPQVAAQVVTVAAAGDTAEITFDASGKFLVVVIPIPAG